MRHTLVVASVLFAVVPPAVASPRAPVAATVRSARAPLAPARGPRTDIAPLCSGDYADEFSIVKPSVREFERDPANKYSYCLRTTAVYECLSYASDGSVRRTRTSVVAHGTGFAYRRANGDTFLLTNDHVATWPSVSGEDHPVEDVPAGCKLVNDSVKIVDDENDDYEANDVNLTRVVTDPGLDVAILKTKAPLKVIPYRIGRSAALQVGDAVTVHGFPLGAFAATNLGKVVNAYDHDTEKDWDHVDFVVDALLSPGNSGSPVMAVSCKTGEYELVGIYHAGYTRGSALNVVVGIDQVRELMMTLKRAPRVSDAARGTGGLGPEDRRVVEALVSPAGGTPLFPFGSLVASGRPLASGAIAFEVFSRGFPLHDERLLVIEDLPPARTGEANAAPGTPPAFGESGRVYFGNARGLRAWDRGALDAEAQAQLDRIVARLRAIAVATAHFRAADAASSKGHIRRRSIEHAIARQAETDKDAVQALTDLAERLGPKPGDKALAWREVLKPEAPEAQSDASDVSHSDAPVAAKTVKTEKK